MNLPRILVVDDEAATRDILSEGLQASGYDCLSASNGREALGILAEGGIDMVLSDIEMPVLGGVDLLREIKSRNAEIDVIMVTGVVDVTTAVEAIRLGASDYLTKPYNLDEVRITVERTWEKRQLIRENRMYQQELEAKVSERTRELRTAYLEIHETYQATLEALIQALDMRDTETRGHSLRVVDFTVEIARAMDIIEPRLTDIRRGALLHDIGKIGIPDAILRKPAKLSDEEWEVMRLHPQLGYEMLAGINFLEAAREIVLSHQERYDGTGYPRRLKGDEIPIGARIFAAADTFDAMTSTRPYRTGLPYEVARQEIIDYRGRQFDPDVVDAFLSIPRSRWEEIRDDVRKRVKEAESTVSALKLVGAMSS